MASVSPNALASGRQLYAGQPGTTVGTLYTAPAASANVPSPYSTAVITEIVLCNTTGSQATISIYVVPSGGTASAANAILYNLPVTANDTKYLSGIATQIPPGGTLQGSQGTAGAITVTVSGYEVQ